MSVYVWPALLFAWLFFMGASIGSFLNVCIARLPSGRTPCWPSSTCFSCFQAIAMRDNIPLISYWLLGGRCRRCAAPFSMRYFWIEFFTGCLFACYYFLEIGFNVHGYQIFGSWGLWFLQAALFPPWSWPVFIIHALMLAFMLTAAMIQWEKGRPAPSVVRRGCAVGLICSVLFPWPFPYDWHLAVSPEGQLVPAAAPTADASWRLLTPNPGSMPADSPWWSSFYSPRLGFTLWPVGGPLPAWFSGPLLGLATGLAGCALGMVLRWICCGGLAEQAVHATRQNRFDDGGVLAIAGSFLGWQPILVSSALVFVAALSWRFAAQRRSLPFSLLAGIAVVTCWLVWAWLAPLLAPMCFNLERSSIAFAVVAVLAFCLRKLG